MTLSATLMSSNVTGTWKLRAMPSRACSSGVARVTSRSAKRMVPSVGVGVAGEAVEERALARAVGADQADDLAFRHVEVGAVHRAEGAERLGDAARFKQHGRRSAPPRGAALSRVVTWRHSTAMPPGWKRVISRMMAP